MNLLRQNYRVFIPKGIIARYSLVGLINTLVTVVIITVLTLLGVDLLVANAVGFGAGLLSSYIGNRYFTFRQGNNKAIGKFLFGFAIAYAANILVAYFVRDKFQPHDLIAQFSGMLTYNVAFFLMMKTWIFNRV